MWWIFGFADLPCFASFFILQSLMQSLLAWSVPTLATPSFCVTWFSSLSTALSRISFAVAFFTCDPKDFDRIPFTSLAASTIFLPIRSFSSFCIV